jgi:hypothetical protein
MEAGKYQNSIAFAKARARRGLMRAALRPLVQWPSHREAADGYTIAIGCSSAIPDILIANLRFLSKQDLSCAREILVVFDCPLSTAPTYIREHIETEFSELPVRWLCYSDAQAAVAKAIDWGWCYAWMSWSLAIGEARTRHVFLHDFDALLLDPALIQERYELALQRGVEFLGTSFYQGNGFTTEDGLVTTFELMLDAAFLKQHFSPIHLFNHVGWLGDRAVEFDTLLYAQSLRGRRAVVPIPVPAMVHPGQMICQTIDLLRRPQKLPRNTSLPLLPYYLYLSDKPEHLIAGTEELEATGNLRLWDRPLRVSEIEPAPRAWLVEQAVRAELAHCGELREEPARYLRALGGPAELESALGRVLEPTTAHG